jgi:hypothetical protein
MWDKPMIEEWKLGMWVQSRCELPNDGSWPDRVAYSDTSMFVMQGDIGHVTEIHQRFLGKGLGHQCLVTITFPNKGWVVLKEADTNDELCCWVEVDDVFASEEEELQAAEDSDERRRQVAIRACKEIQRLCARGRWVAAMRRFPQHRTGVSSIGWEQTTSGSWYVYPIGVDWKDEASEFDTVQEAADHINYLLADTNMTFAEATTGVRE